MKELDENEKRASEDCIHVFDPVPGYSRREVLRCQFCKIFSYSFYFNDKLMGVRHHFLTTCYDLAKKHCEENSDLNFQPKGEL